MSDYFPEELLPKILCRLPIKSLIHYTIVSKKWRSLITSSSFISAHLSHRAADANNNHHLLLLRHYSKTLPKEHYSLHLGTASDHRLPLRQTLPCPFRSAFKFYFRFVGCFNGLLCLSDDFFGPTGTIILWNPLIRRYLKLPKPTVDVKTYGRLMTALGFGFDSSSDDHKVVRVSYLQTGGRILLDVTPPLVEIYSVRRGGWKPINAAGVDLCLLEHWWTQSFVSGSIHWLSFKRRPHQGFDLWILVFDVKNEVFKKMKLPNLKEKLPMFMQICSPFRGLLAVAEYVADIGVSKRTDIWVKTDYNDRNSWTKMFSVRVNEGIGMALSFTGNGRILFSTKDGELVSYYPETKEAKNLGVHGCVEAFHVASYTESLVLLDEESHAVSYGSAKRTVRWDQDGATIEEDDDDNQLGGMAEIAMGLLNNQFAFSQMIKVVQGDPIEL